MRGLADKLRSRMQFGAVAGDWLLRLGLLGTIVRFILMLFPLATLYNFEAVRRHGLTRCIRTRSRIKSCRNLEILRLLAKGGSLPQIADTLGIGYKTAANNCSRVKANPGAADTAELIRITIRSGLVDQEAGPLGLAVDSPARSP